MALNLVSSMLIDFFEKVFKLRASNLFEGCFVALHQKQTTTTKKTKTNHQPNTVQVLVVTQHQTLILSVLSFAGWGIVGRVFAKYIVIIRNTFGSDDCHGVNTKW